MVKWETVLYTIVPLATATMSQPVGSVLGTHPMSRTWLRSSPILCVVDVVAFIAEVMRYCLQGKIPLRDAFQFATEKRFKDVEDDGERLQYLRRSFALRWLFFLIGTHASMFKLVGARGLAWTKAIGLCFAVSFVFFELVIYLYPKLRSDDGRIPTRSLFRSKWQKPTKIGFWLAALSQCLLMLWTLWDLVGIETRKIPRDPTRDYIKISIGSWIFSTFCLLLCFSSLFVERLIRGQHDLPTWQRWTFLMCLVPFSMCGFLTHLVFLLNERFTSPDNPNYDPDNPDLAVNTAGQNRLFGSVLLAGALYVLDSMIWPALPLRLPSLAEKLLVIDGKTAKQIREETFRVEITPMETVVGGLQVDRTWLKETAFTMFLANATFFVLWYRYCYDPSSTSYPGWTSGMS